MSEEYVKLDRNQYDAMLLSSIEKNNKWQMLKNSLNAMKELRKRFEGEDASGIVVRANGVEYLVISPAEAPLIIDDFIIERDRLNREYKLLSEKYAELEKFNSSLVKRVTAVQEVLWESCSVHGRSSIFDSKRKLRDQLERAREAYGKPF